MGSAQSQVRNGGATCAHLCVRANPVAANGSGPLCFGTSLEQVLDKRLLCSFAAVRSLEFLPPDPRWPCSEFGA
jgi:hypothetical protein